MGKTNLITRTPRRTKDGKPTFAALSSDWICQMPKFTRKAIVLYTYLRDRNNANREDQYARNESFPAYETITRDTGLNANQIRDATLELATAGFLRMELEEIKTDGSRASNHYFTNDVPVFDAANYEMIKSRSWHHTKQTKNK